MTMTRSTKSEHLIYGYQICASTEGKSPAAIAAVTLSVKIFLRFLNSQCGGMPVTEVTFQEIRAFIFHLQHAKCFSVHPTIHVLDKGLSGHTVNCYLRSLRIFFSWLVSEDILPNHPFEKVKIPRPPTKIIPAFSPSQIQQLLSVINTRTPAGYRDYLIILTLLDTGLRFSELCSMTLEKLWLEDGTARVLGKGNKERLVPIGKRVQRLLWRYIERFRPEPVNANCDFVFLNQKGRPIGIQRVQKMMKIYGRKAGLVGIRCSPHTLRHTAAITFLRNGGDVFSLQRLLGHSNLEMTRRYCELATVDVKKAHDLASPVDNFGFTIKSAGLGSAHGYKGIFPSMVDKDYRRR